MTQRLVAGAAHGRGEGHGALQGTVLLAATSTRQDYNTTIRLVRWVQAEKQSLAKTEDILLEKTRC